MSNLSDIVTGGYSKTLSGNIILSDPVYKYAIFENINAGVVTLNNGVTEFVGCKFRGTASNLNINNSSGQIIFRDCDFYAGAGRSILFNMGSANDVLFYDCRFGVTTVQSIGITANKIDFYGCNINTYHLKTNTNSSQGVRFYNCNVQLSLFGLQGTPTTTQDVLLESTYFSCQSISDSATIPYEIAIQRDSHFQVKTLDFLNTASSLLLANNSRALISQYSSPSETIPQITVGSLLDNDHSVLELGKIEPTQTRARMSIHGTLYYVYNFDSDIRLSKNIFQERFTRTFATVSAVDLNIDSGTPITVLDNHFQLVGRMCHFTIIATIKTTNNNSRAVCNFIPPAGFSVNNGPNAFDVVGTILPRIDTSNITFNGIVENDGSIESIKVELFGPETATETQYIISGHYEVDYTTTRF